MTLLFSHVLILSLLAQLTPIAEGGGPDVAEWNTIMEPYLGVSWLDTPWLYSEFYAYRRVVEAFSFFETGKGANTLLKAEGVSRLGVFHLIVVHARGRFRNFRVLRANCVKRGGVEWGCGGSVLICCLP